MAAYTNKKGLSKASIITVVVLLVLVAAGVAAYVVWGLSATSDSAIVHDADGGETVLPLNEDAEVTITTSLGSNTVVVEGGEVYVSEADCPNHDCMQQGRISAAGEEIICLPHKLWIEISGSDDASEGSSYDTLTR